MVEEYVSFVRELALMAVRDQAGNMKFYPVVETVQQNHICHIVRCPASIEEATALKAMEIAEKALTAIALVFAIFQLNPAPFCLLDEVDAPLDDANTERYAKLVTAMSRHTQFLFISHNKIAMEMAEQLIGVTMQEQGISRIVAVDMEAALGFAEAA